MTVFQSDTNGAQAGGDILGDVVYLVEGAASRCECTCDLVHETCARETSDVTGVVNAN